jgi:hypothetical protein
MDVSLFFTISTDLECIIWVVEIKLYPLGLMCSVFLHSCSHSQCSCLLIILTVCAWYFRDSDEGSNLVEERTFCRCDQQP